MRGTDALRRSDAVARSYRAALARLVRGEGRHADHAGRVVRISPASVAREAGRSRNPLYTTHRDILDENEAAEALSDAIDASKMLAIERRLDKHLATKVADRVENVFEASRLRGRTFKTRALNAASDRVRVTDAAFLTGQSPRADVDDDALAAERASAFGISISGCKRGKVMGLCAYPEGSGACPVTCGTCGQ